MKGVIGKLCRGFLAGTMMVSAGCSTVQEGSQAVQRKAAAVGGTLQTQAVKVRRKTQGFWQRLFGSDDSTERQPADPARSDSKKLPPTPRLDAESQPYVGAGD